MRGRINLQGMQYQISDSQNKNLLPSVRFKDIKAVVQAVGKINCVKVEKRIIQEQFPLINQLVNSRLRLVKDA